jgi:glycosyltransferase involved in cell wall biosynthesis
MSLSIAVLGTRGIPANYGGFETFAEELSIRLVRRGHRVTVYGRSHYVASGPGEYRGVRLVRLPAFRSKYLETVSHTALSVLDALWRPFDVVLMCNAANAFACWVPRLRGQKVVLNVDGIERMRRKWSRLGKGYYRLSERLATLFPNRVVTDARTIQAYYLDHHGCRTTFIPYGAPTERTCSREVLDRLGVEPGEYLLYVSRLEPENNAHNVIGAFRRANPGLPLVLVGDAPYGRRYIEELRRLAEGSPVVMPGAIYGVGYRELLSHCRCYLHGTEVGGTHPALLEAMGAGCLVLAHDTPENREVLGNCGFLCRFTELETFSELLRDVVLRSEELTEYRAGARRRVRELYDWERVTDRYEALFHDLVG